MSDDEGLSVFLGSGISPYGRRVGQRGTRLAKILPGQWKDRIRCWLIPHDIDQVPPTRYKALSYVWGSPNVVELIELNGENHGVTVNLACAIRHIRNTEMTVVIWIDALCINQRDTNEKGRQVAMMRDIYAGAEDVLVFLGDGIDYRISKAYLLQPPESPVVFWNDSRDESLLRRFRDSLASIWKDKSWNAFCAICLVRSLSHECDIKSIIEKTQARSRQEIFELLRRLTTEPWWQRIWVVQEIAIPAKATVRYGNVTAPWEMFVQAAQATASWSYSLNIEAGYSKVISLFTRQVLDLEDLRAEWKGSNGTNLLSLLQKFSNRKATNERDKIYALLGLASEKGLLWPRYSMGINELYMMTVIALINHHHNLAPLSGDLRRKNRQSQGLASWIPDWSAIVEESDRKRMALQGVYNACSGWRLAVSEEYKEYWTYEAEQLHLLIQDLQTPGRRPRQITVQLREAIKKFIIKNQNGAHIFPAMSEICRLCTLLLKLTEGGSQDTPAPTIIKTEELFNFGTISSKKSISKCDRVIENCDPRFEKYALHTQSRFLARVLWCGTKLTSWMDIDSGLLTVGTWMKELFGSQSIIQLSGDDSVKTTIWRFMRTLVGGVCWRAGSFNRISVEDYASLGMWFGTLLLPQLQNICSIDEEVTLVVDHMIESHGSISNKKGFDREMRLVTEGRVFFLTEGGDMGLGPASMAPTDEIHVLPGGQTRFVLRPESESKTRRFELIGDCFLDQDPSEPDGGERPLEGSLPREILRFSHDLQDVRRNICLI